MEQKDMYYNKAEYIETVSMRNCSQIHSNLASIKLTEFKQHGIQNQ